MLDMSKAYDRVSHKILLDKLYGVGIRGNAHKWIKSYLTDRKQLVQIDYLDERTGELSTPCSNLKTINCSIPQGSVIGCLLFLVYINDLPKILNTHCVLFADDISLLFKCNELDKNNIDKIINTFNAAKKWLEDHNLVVNENKTKIIQFKTYNKNLLNLTQIRIKLNIEEAHTFKLLGITLDTHLNWKKHIEEVTSKLSKFIFALTLLKKNTNIHCALAAYYAYAYAWLRYGVLMWGHSTNMIDLLIKQKKILRIMYNIKPRESCRQYFAKQNILTLPSIYILELAMFVRQNPHLFQLVQSNRRNNNLVIPSSRLTIFQNSPYYKCLQVYNKLPKTIKTEESDNQFKNKLKSILIKKSYYSLKEFMEDRDFK